VDSLEEAKGECGLGDYQALGWQAWHHHVNMVMGAMLFIAEQRAAQSPGSRPAVTARHR
jgi:SRSO17 transposase